MSNELSCKGQSSDKYAGKFTPFDECAAKVASMRIREAERTERLLNDEKRRMGLDLPGLALQTELKQQEQTDNLKRLASDAAAVRLGHIEMNLLEEENKKSAQLSKERYAQDLQDQIDLKRSIAASASAAERIGACGPASLQVFEGEDIGGSDRRRFEAKQHIACITEQLKSHIKPKEYLPESPNPVEELIRDQILNRGRIQRQFNEVNFQLSEEKRKRDDVQNKKEFMSHVETRVTDFKGLSPLERKAILAENIKMVDEHKAELDRIKFEGIKESKLLEKEILYAEKIENEKRIFQKQNELHNLSVSSIHSQINRNQKNIQETKTVDTKDDFLTRFGNSLYYLFACSL